MSLSFFLYFVFHFSLKELQSHIFQFFNKSKTFPVKKVIYMHNATKNDIKNCIKITKKQ